MQYTSERQSIVAEDKDHDNHFSPGSIGTQEEKQRDNYEIFNEDQLITTEKSLADQLISYLDLESIRKNSSDTAFHTSICWNTVYVLKLLLSVICLFFHNSSVIVC